MFNKIQKEFYRVVIVREKRIGSEGSVAFVREIQAVVFHKYFSCWLLRGLSVEDIVGVQEKARRAFGLETLNI